MNYFPGPKVGPPEEAPVSCTLQSAHFHAGRRHPGDTHCAHTPLQLIVLLPCSGGSTSQLSTWLLLEKQQCWGDLSLPLDANQACGTFWSQASFPAPRSTTWGSWVTSLSLCLCWGG